MKTKRKNVYKALKVLSFIVVFVIIIGLMMFCSVYFSTKLDKSAIAVPKARILVYDAEGELIENLRLSKYIPYGDISPNVINAFVALEDKRFFKHKGIDYYR